MAYDHTTSFLTAPIGTAANWADFIRQYNPPEADALAEAYFRLGAMIGINADFALAQGSIETAHWTSGHWINVDPATGTPEKNPAGLGITGDGVTGEYFGTIERAVKAHYAHLAAYIFRADNDPYPALVAADPQWQDPRYHFNDGHDTVDTLEQPDTGLGAHRWAASGYSYVTNIVSLANQIAGEAVPAQPTPPPPPPTPFPVVSEPTILENLTHVNTWEAGEWPGRAALPVRALVLHIMAGSYNGSIGWFQNPSAKASANFCVSYDGEITMCVDPDVQAPWANGITNAASTALPPGLADLASGRTNANWVTVSIETEGYDPNDGTYPHVPEYASVVRLMAHLCTKYQLHPSTDTICRHTYFDTVNRPNCPGNHWQFDTLITDIQNAMNIPVTPVDPNDPYGVESPDKQYRYFGLTGKNVGHGIKTFYEADGVRAGIVRYGYPLTEELTETREDGSEIRCQWFERVRIEWDTAKNVATLGLIGQELATFLNRISVLGGSPLYLNTAGPERVNLPIDPRIKPYYDTNGGLAIFGYPLATALPMYNETITVQFFERAVLEIHPESAKWPVQGRRVGAEWLAWRESQRAKGEQTIPIVSA